MPKLALVKTSLIVSGVERVKNVMIVKDYFGGVSRAGTLIHDMT